MKGYLVLEDGTLFEGNILGGGKSRMAEVVFNTGMTGYEEIITDPSYFGQIVVLTYPMIGNYGVSQEDRQSSSPKVSGLIVREMNKDYFNWRASGNLEDYLAENDIIALESVDTRALVKYIRNKGTMIGIIVSEAELENIDVKDLEAFQFKYDLKDVSTPEPYVIGSGCKKVAVLDFGIKKNILDSLAARNVELKVFPAHASCEEIIAYQPDGVFLSNGPGDPSDYMDVIETVKQLIGKLPIFGICLGHQLLCIALGGETKKLKYGHRGSNHPVKDLNKDKIIITSQNHGYVVDDESLKGLDAEVTHYSVNDDSIEGIKHKTYPIFSVQYHPEASPGPGDSSYLFDQFIEMMEVTS